MKTHLPCAQYFQKYICLLLFFSFNLFSASAQNIDFGKSFVNITKGISGGSIEPGDVLEIRASIVVRAGTYDSCGYFDAVPAGTSFIPGSIRVLTNEGKIYKQFTDVTGDDCGWIASPNIRINLGYVAAAAPATAFRRGRIVNTNKPSFFGGTCIMVASFRVVVTSAYNNFINIGGGSMTYKTGGVLQSFTFPGNTIMVYQNFGICSNTVGVNAIGTEFNGTFGSGKPRNRGTSANVPPGYTFSIFTNTMPNDYFYGIANNTSSVNAYTTINTWAKPDNSLPTHRVFKFWDIIGDHTGAASPTLGNPAADTVANPNAGYMLVINAAYRIDSAFQQTITGLCPNTYYEISCWLRNICSKCGCDSNGVGAGGAGYIPTAANDSSGVSPNLTMSVDNISYYTTGNIPYTQTWVKKGFTVLTGPLQTSFTVKFFNNAPGGGGNDWALDDISIATCSPDLTLLPSANPMICAGNIVNMSCLVKSFFNNYTYYKWQKSIDNGATWANDGPTGGPATPTWMGADWEYTVVHPTFIANQPDSGSKYRIVLATTPANLTNTGCSFSQSTVITLKVIDCGPILGADLISFTAKRQDDHVQLNWTTTKEETLLHFTIEKSEDAKSFIPIATINGYNNGQNMNFYAYPDPDTSKNIVYYRLKMTDDKNRNKYSRVIEINENDDQVTLANLVNPFDQKIKFDMIVPKSGKVNIELINLSGKIVDRKEIRLNDGLNQVSIDNLDIFPTGVYILRVEYNNKVTLRKIVKIHG